MQIDLEHGLAAGGLTVVTIVAGVLTKVLTKVVSLHIKKMELDFAEKELEFSESTRLRTDITKRCEQMESELKSVRNELDFWRDKYHTEIPPLKAQVETLTIESKAHHVQLRDIKSRNWIPDKEKDRYE